jgi:tetratricopeptide (TPR) repeat protein
LALHRISGFATDLAAIKASAQRSNEILDSLRDKTSDRPDPHAVTIGLNDYNIGNADYSGRHFLDAAASFTKGVQIFDEQIRRGDRSEAIQLHLANTLRYLCRAYKDERRSEAALAAGERSIATYRAILDLNPDRYACALDLFWGQTELSFIYEQLGRFDQVIACREAARATLKAQIARPGVVISRMADLQGLLAIADYNLGQAYPSDFARYAQRLREVVEEAYGICDKLTIVKTLPQELLQILATTSHQMAEYQDEDGERPDLERYDRAERIWAKLYRSRPDVVTFRAGLAMVRLDLADELELRGRADEARAFRERSLSSVQGDAGILFEIVLNEAENSRLIGTYPVKLDPKGQERRRRKYLRRAVRVLHEAVASGFRDAARLRQEPLLAPLRAEPEFHDIVASLDDRAFPADPFARP